MKSNPCILSKRGNKERKGQESLLNIMAAVLVVSVIFLYLFYVTQSQRIESSKISADQQKYKYAEIVLTNMYYIKPYGSSGTISEIIGMSEQFGNRMNDYEYMSLNSIVRPKAMIKQYLDKTLSDYKYYFYVEKDGKKSLEINAPPESDTEIMAHMIAIPLPDLKSTVFAYLYLW